jgi:zinc protease
MTLLATVLPAAEAQVPRVVTLDSAGPLLYVRVMVKAGSASDPQGLEGLAYLTGRLLIEGGFGDPKKPVTKEQLAEMTRPWGEGAYPSVRVGKDTTSVSMTVPRERFAEYSARVLKPLFTQPLFSDKELDRLRKETLEDIRSNLRFQQIELLGLLALDNAIHDGTSYAHLTQGTVQGLEQVKAESARGFYRTWYRPENLTIAVSTADNDIVNELREALSGVGEAGKGVEAYSPRAVGPPSAVSGRHVIIIGLPKAIASGVHAGFPIPLTRSDADYWPLFVANVWFGTHRDSFSHLYQVFREERGYNYGDYSYIEYFEGRPLFLFPPANSPRRYQYFSVWIRPVANEYTHHLMKALTCELENFIRNGLTPEQVEAAKNKARVLYLSYAENVDRLVGYKLDDDFYGMSSGYLDQYLSRIDAATPEAVNAAIRKYLQVENLRYIVVTDQSLADKLADDIAQNRNAGGKSLKDYQLDAEEREGNKYWLVTDRRLQALKQDALWEAYRLGIPRSNIHVVKAEQMFETASFPQ